MANNSEEGQGSQRAVVPVMMMIPSTSFVWAANMQIHLLIMKLKSTSVFLPLSMRSEHICTAGTRAHL
jgi:hypothetical protein